MAALLLVPCLLLVAPMSNNRTSRASRPAQVALATALLAPTLWVRAGVRTPALLAPEYAVKSWIAIVAMTALAILLLVQGAREKRIAVRPPRLLAAMLALVACHGAAGLLAAHQAYFDVTETLLRVVLLAAAAAVIVAGVPIGSELLGALRLTALALAALVLLDLTHVCKLLLPSQSSPSATLLHRNNVGMELAAALPLFALRIIRWQPRTTWRRALELALVAAALFGCRSRTAWLAAGAGLVIVAFLTVRAQRSAGLRRWAAIPILLVAGLGAARSLRASQGLEPLDDRLSHAVSLGDPAMRERYDIYRDALRLVAAHPLLGWGAGRFALLRRAQFATVEPAHPDAATIDPEWSAVGGELAFTTDSGASALFVSDGAGGRPRAVRTPLPLPSHPAISPDGSIIAVHENRAQSRAVGRAPAADLPAWQRPNAGRGGDGRERVRRARRLFA